MTELQDEPQRAHPPHFRRAEEDFDDGWRPSHRPYEPESSGLLKSVWQLITYVLGATLIATWVWVWNTQSEILNLRNTALRIPELVLRADANRTTIEINSNRISKLEEALQRGRDDRDDLRQQDRELREAIDNMGRALSGLQNDHIRLVEMVRQMVGGERAPSESRPGESRPGESRPGQAYPTYPDYKGLPH